MKHLLFNIESRRRIYLKVNLSTMTFINWSMLQKVLVTCKFLKGLSL